jgi:hypothetical protein
MKTIALHWTRYPRSEAYIAGCCYWERISFRHSNAFIACITVPMNKGIISVRICPDDDGVVGGMDLRLGITEDEAKEFVDSLLTDAGVKLLKESYRLLK